MHIPHLTIRPAASSLYIYWLRFTIYTTHMWEIINYIYAASYVRFLSVCVHILYCEKMHLPIKPHYMRLILANWFSEIEPPRRRRRMLRSPHTIYQSLCLCVYTHTRTHIQFNSSNASLNFYIVNHHHWTTALLLMWWTRRRCVLQSARSWSCAVLIVRVCVCAVLLWSSTMRRFNLVPGVELRATAAMNHTKRARAYSLFE